MAQRVTVPTIRATKGGAPLVMVTAYDAPTARIADDAGVDVILVGDSVAMVVLGYDDTLQVTVDDMAHHVAAVGRARPRALVVADTAAPEPDDDPDDELDADDELEPEEAIEATGATLLPDRSGTLSGGVASAGLALAM